MVDGVNLRAAMTAWRNSVPVIVSEIVSGLFIDLLIVTGNRLVKQINVWLFLNVQ